MNLSYAKTPVGPSLNRIAQKRALDQIDITGKSLPCQIQTVISSGIVTVAFQVDAGPASLQPVTVPVVMSQYVRIPLKAGDPGVCIPADVRLGGVTGLGAGVPTLWDRPGNLSTLMFLPLSSTAWSSVDLTALVLFDQTRSHSLSVTGSGVKIDGNMTVTPNGLGFFGGSATSKKTVSGQCTSATTVTQLAATVKSLLNALSAAGYDLITDSTT